MTKSGKRRGPMEQSIQTDDPIEELELNLHFNGFVYTRGSIDHPSYIF